MSQSLQLKIKGLYTSSNELSEVPEGALLVADNIDIAKDSIAEPRRGFERVTGGFSNAAHRSARTWFYQDKQFAHHGTLGSESTLSYLNSGTWTSVGSFTAPTGVKMRQLEANQNLYYTTSTGVRKLDAYNGTAVLAGAYKALDLTATLGSNGTAMLTNTAVAYRVVWGYKDANRNLILGAPSARATITNSSGNTKDVTLDLSIPSGITTSWFYQIYRSAEVSDLAEPSDELGLVYEANPTAGEITAGTISVSDVVPEALRGATIYTAASQDGLANQNERPPLAKDLATFRGVTFYANVTSKHRYYLTLLAVGGATGLVLNDTLTIGGVAFTAKAAEATGSGQFKLSTGGSASQNVADTAKSLVRTINRYSSSTVYAYYLSGPDDQPGMMLIEERAIGGSAFVLLSSQSRAWNPAIPTVVTTETSTNDTYANGLMWSKEGQSEAVPLPNFAEVGSRSADILRIVPLKDALMIFKEDGIYKLTGYYGSFSIEELDSSARLIGPETPTILNGQIFCLTDQGATVVSDGVKIISRPIEQELLDMFAADLDLVKTTSFGIGYETERKYMLFIAGSDVETYPSQAFVYNVFTATWVRHVLGATAGVVYDNRLYLADGTSNYMLRDRKSRTYLDYADYGFSTTITAVTGTVATLGTGADLVSIGDVLYQSSTCFSIITAVDTLTSQVTLLSNPGFTTSSVDILYAITCDIKWAPVTLGNPGTTKQVHTAQLLFKTDFNGTGYLSFSSDLSQYDEPVAIVGLGVLGWGLRSFGSGPWGGAPRKRPVRQWVPRNKQRCSQLTLSFQHAVGFSPWQLQGVSVFATPGTDRTGR